jgi:hypothetical protein
MFRSALIATLATAAATSTLASAAPTVIQPTEITSKDVFLYEGAPGNWNGAPFGHLLSSGMTGTGHDIRTLVQFDLTGVTIDPGETATLNLFTAAGPFGASPTPAFPVIVDVYAATSTWDETTVQWSDQPTFGASSIASKSIDGVGQWVSFDVTSQVQAWLANPATNFGFVITQPSVALNGTGQKVVAAYSSAAGANPPSLFVAVPEPAALAPMALVVLAARRRRRIAPSPRYSGERAGERGCMRADASDGRPR